MLQLSRSYHTVDLKPVQPVSELSQLGGAFRASVLFITASMEKIMAQTKDKSLLASIQGVEGLIARLTKLDCQLNELRHELVGPENLVSRGAEARDAESPAGMLGGLSFAIDAAHHRLSSVEGQIDAIERALGRSGPEFGGAEGGLNSLNGPHPQGLKGSSVGRPI